MRNYTTILFLLLSITSYTQNDFELVVWMLKCSEGFRAKNYNCTANKSTIGYGTQSKQATITKKEAQKRLYQHFEKDYQIVKKNYPTLVKRQHLILAALMYNSGKVGKELDYRIKNGLPVADIWIQYSTVRGQTAKYLIKRRAIELDIWNGVNLNYYYNYYKECVCNQK